MKTEIIFLNCGNIDHLLATVNQDIRGQSIQILTQSTDNPSLFIKNLSVSGRRCAVITSGTIKNSLSDTATIPVISIATTLLDILLTLKTAKIDISEVAVIINKVFYPDYDMIIPMIRVIPFTMFIESYEELKDVTEILKKRGVKTVLGSNTVCSIVKNYGLNCISFWNENNVRKAITEAIEAVNRYYNNSDESETEDVISGTRAGTKKNFTALTKFEQILGDCSEMVSLKKYAELYAHTDSSILIQGESGTGKELFAQGIHNASKRCQKPFVPINLAAIPETLIESELFGYEGGAFSGARRNGKRGYFELAHGGTLFLDEIGDMPLPLQSRLLRVLEEGKLFRLGGETQKQIDVRIIAATNKNLTALVNQNQFRGDLLYRLNVLEINIPPLRERIEDIPLIALHFLHEFKSQATPGECHRVAHSKQLLSYSWPGNVRELRNVMERFCAIYDGTHDIDKSLEISLGHSKQFSHPALSSTIQSEYSLKEILEKNHGNRNLAAEELGISRSTLWRRMKEQNLL